MSFNRLRYDAGAYEHQLYESVGPGLYQTAVPLPNASCTSDDPRMRLQRPCDAGRVVDAGSDLEGLNRRATKCPSLQYLPGSGPVYAQCSGRGGGSGSGCARPEEDTRLSNPPCTLRGTGVNRFDPLFWDPQARAVEPWAHREGTSYRLVAKDNHRPCLPTAADVDRACGGWAGDASSALDPSPPSSQSAPVYAPPAPTLAWVSAATIGRL